MKRNYSVNSTAINSGGVSMGTALFIVFLILKLTHVINWSWWWITAPMWIPLCIVFILLIIYAIWDANNKRK